MFPSEAVEFGWLVLVGVGTVSELAAAVLYPSIEAAVGSDGSGVKVFQADPVEADASWLGRGEGGFGVSGCGSLGEGDAAGDGPAEVVGDVALEPAVEQVAVPGRAGAGSLAWPPAGMGCSPALLPPAGSKLTVHAWEDSACGWLPAMLPEASGAARGWMTGPVGLQSACCRPAGRPCWGFEAFLPDVSQGGGRGHAGFASGGGETDGDKPGRQNADSHSWSI